MKEAQEAQTTNPKAARRAKAEPTFIQEVVRWAMQAGNAETLFDIASTLRREGDFDEANAWAELARRALPDGWEMVALAALTDQPWHGEDLFEIALAAKSLLDDMEIAPSHAARMRAEIERKCRRAACAGAHAEHTS